VGNLCQYLTTFIIKKLFRKYEWDFFNLICTRSSCPVTVHHLEESGSVLFTIPHQVLINAGKVLHEYPLLEARQLLSVTCMSGASIPSVVFVALHWTHSSMVVFLVAESPVLDTALQMWPHEC